MRVGNLLLKFHLNGSSGSPIPTIGIGLPDDPLR